MSLVQADALLLLGLYYLSPLNQKYFLSTVSINRTALVVHQCSQGEYNGGLKFKLHSKTSQGE